MAYESFEIVTDQSKTRLPLQGSLLGWDDNVENRVVEHLILNRPGAIHQVQARGPRRFALRCLLRDPGAAAKRNQVDDTLGLEPFCKLIHPRVGQVPIVYRGLKVSEDVDRSINGLVVDLSVDETGLRDGAKATAQQAAKSASEASSAAETAAAKTTRSATLTPLAVSLSSQVAAFDLALGSNASQLDLGLALARVGAASQELVQAAGVDVLMFPVVSAARLAYGQALTAYRLAAQGQPIIVYRPVPARMSVARLCQSLYGGGAQALETQFLRLNHVPNPFAIEAGSMVYYPDPSTVNLG